MGPHALTSLFYPGRAEGLKTAVHATAGTVATLCALYNSIAWCLRRESHLLHNAMFYAACACFEHYQVQRHREARKGEHTA